MRWIQSKTHNFGKNLLLLKNVQWCDFLATDTKLAPSRKKMLFPVNRWESILLEQWISIVSLPFESTSLLGGDGGFWQDPSREKRNMNAANSFWTNSSCLNQLISNYQRYLTVCIRKIKLWHAPGERNCFCKYLAAFSSVGSCAVYLIRKGFK